MSDPVPNAKLELRFMDHAVLEHVGDPIERDLSAVARWEDSLFLSCDETASVERLTESDRHWGNHRHFNLGGAGGPARGTRRRDGRGGARLRRRLALGDGLARAEASPAAKAADPAEALAQMEKIGRDANRYFLGRFPLERGPDGLAPAASEGDRKGRASAARAQAQPARTLAAQRPAARAVPVDPVEGERARPRGNRGARPESVARAARTGAARMGGDPLARAGAETDDGGSTRGASTGGGAIASTSSRGRRPRRPRPGARRRRLLILTGPVLGTEGPARVLRWRGAVDCRSSGAHPKEAAPAVLELPYHGMVDHAEGLVRWGEDWLVVYDSPSERRLEGEGACVTADIWAIP